MTRRWFTCDQVVAAHKLPDKHCNSCHQDDDEGYSPMAEIDDDVDVAPVCCEVLRQLRHGFARDDAKILDVVRAADDRTADGKGNG